MKSEEIKQIIEVFIEEVKHVESIQKSTKELNASIERKIEFLKNYRLEYDLKPLESANNNALISIEKTTKESILKLEKIYQSHSNQIEELYIKNARNSINYFIYLILVFLLCFGISFYSLNSKFKAEKNKNTQTEHFKCFLRENPNSAKEYEKWIEVE